MRLYTLFPQTYLLIPTSRPFSSEPHSISLLCWRYNHTLDTCSLLSFWLASFSPPLMQDWESCLRKLLNFIRCHRSCNATVKFFEKEQSSWENQPNKAIYFFPHKSLLSSTQLFPEDSSIPQGYRAGLQTSLISHPFYPE